jgi:transcription antitermination factor NusG
LGTHRTSQAGINPMNLKPQMTDAQGDLAQPYPDGNYLPWFALQVRSRYEESVAEHLSGKGYELFLPLYKCRKRWSDRIKVIEAPLFPGYLFCRFNPQNRLPILKTPGVIQVVGYNRTPVPVDDGEIDAIQRFIASGIPSQPWPFLQVGDRVRIESGPLRGLEGILIKFKGNHRLVVSVTLLQRSVAAVVDSTLVSSLQPFRMPAHDSADLHPQPIHVVA